MLERRGLIRTMAGGLLAAAALTPLAALGPPKRPLTPGRGVCSAPGLSYAALYIAKRRGMWDANGVDYKLTLTQGGPLALAALNAGEADFACLTSSDSLISWDKGIKILTVAAFTTLAPTQLACSLNRQVPP